MLPSTTHERVRSNVASPLSGRVGRQAHVRGWVADLDAAILAEPSLTDLPGRFLFSVDDGHADMSGLGADVGMHVLDGGVALLLALRDTGVRLAVGDVVDRLIKVAARFVSSAKRLGG